MAVSTSAVVQKKRSMRYSGRSEKKAEIWQQEVRARLSGLLNIDDLLATGKSVPLNPTEVRTENKEDYLLKEIEINSTSNRRIRVIVTCPLLSTGPWPAVVCIHGHGGKPASVYDKESPYKAFADALARRNYVTIAPIVSQHEIYEESRTLMGERLWDCMRCIDYLESLISVDANRIGCAGLSLGGEMAMWLGAMDQRIKATVSAGFLTRMDQMEQGHCLCWKFPGLRELVDYADIYSLIAPRPLLCQNGLKEPPTDFTVELARAALKEIQVIYLNYGQLENVTLVAHQEGHVVDVQSLLTFFKKQFNPIKSSTHEE
jgi:dienelactone hydrolase